MVLQVGHLKQLRHPAVKMALRLSCQKSGEAIFANLRRYYV